MSSSFTSMSTVKPLLAALSLLAAAHYVAADTVQPLELLPNQTWYIADTYGSCAVVPTVQSKLILFDNGPQEIELTLEYGMSRAYLAIPGLVMCLIALVTWPFFCICRCCNKCGGNELDVKPQGYTTFQRWGLFGILSFFSLGSAGMAGLGIWANQELDKNISGSSGLTGNIGETFVNANTFFVSVQASMENILTVAGNVIGQLPTIITNTIAPINSDISILNYHMSTIAAAYQNTNVQAQDSAVKHYNESDARTSVYGTQSYCLKNGTTAGSTFDASKVTPCNATITYPCSTCVALGNAVKDLNNAVLAVTNPVQQSLNSSIDAINGTLVNSYATIQTDIEDAVTHQVTSVTGQLNDADHNSKTYRDQVDTYEVYRVWAMVGILALPMLTTVMIFIATAAKLRGLYTATVHIQYLTLVLTWLLFALHLLLLRVSSDGCTYADKKQVDLASVSEIPVAAQNVLESCLLNTTLTSALGLDSQLNFTNAIQLPPLNFSSNSITGLSQIATVQNQINNINSSAFGAVDVQAVVNQINQVTNSNSDCLKGQYAPMTQTGSYTVGGSMQNGPPQNCTDTFSASYSDPNFVGNLGTFDTFAMSGYNQAFGYCKYCGATDDMCQATYNSGSSKWRHDDNTISLWSSAIAGGALAFQDAFYPQTSSAHTYGDGNVPPQDFLCDQIKTPSTGNTYNPCSCQLAFLRYQVLTALYLKDQSTATVSNMNNNFSTLTGDVDRLSAAGDNLVNNAYPNLIKNVQPIIDAANQAIDGTRCGWLGQDYLQLKGNVCGQRHGGDGGSVTAIGWIACALFCIGTCQIACLIATLYLQKRIKFPSHFSEAGWQDGEAIQVHSPVYALDSNDSPAYHMAPEMSPSDNQYEIPPGQFGDNTASHGLTVANSGYYLPEPSPENPSQQPLILQPESPMGDVDTTRYH